MQKEQKAELLCQVEARLGEGPVWDAQNQVLYWVDLRGEAFFCYDPRSKQNRRIPFPGIISTLVQRETKSETEPGFLAACGRDLRFITKEGKPTGDSLFQETQQPGNRLNDGKCDAKGRFWFGTMDNAEENPTGSLYVMGSDLQPRAVDSGYTVSNGPAFSPDGATLYHADSPNRVVYAFTIEEDGALSDKRVHIRLDSDDGYPDGMTVDKEGFLWVGIWNGWRLQRFDPRGRAVECFKVPVAQVTSCTFVGEELDQLYITTAGMGKEKAPLAGSLFCARPTVGGFPSYRFCG